ncbi:M15 family metallopeptidase [Paenibacillus sp. Marseille-Q4541]|uniref:M15 family metallopeptidase n=1 Tax=Paenibacillus sp. Marseille-Q4541 TaxID=2831522 RepID=UPI002018AEDD|nr:M15 family metallopeptidase [Paenibacillus sp. Marseille-Q4541]
MTITKMKRHRWTIVLLSTLLLGSVLLTGCEEGGQGQKEGQNLNSPSTGDTSQEVTPEAPTEGTGNTSDGSEIGEGDTEVDSIMAMRAQNSLQSNVEKQGDLSVVTNAEAMTVIVNKQRSLPEGYEPSDLVEPNVPFSFDGPHEKRHLRKEAAGALEQLFAAAENDGIELRAVSGYRSYQRQVSVYNSSVERNGEEYAARVSAKPGYSEHQTGLSIDVSSPSVGNVIEEVFGDSEEGKWLKEHAPEYGFVIRYPEGREETTGYVYEPWHIRYVGKELAPDIAESGLTLEEYFDEDNIKL